MRKFRANRITGRRSNGILIVSCQVNSSYYGDFLVDTGAALTVVSQKFAEEADLDILYPVRYLSVASVHRVVKSPVIKLDALQVGSQISRNIEVLVLSLPSELRVDGLLGINFLEKFRTTFEFEQATLILRSISHRI